MQYLQQNSCSHHQSVNSSIADRLQALLVLSPLGLLSGLFWLLLIKLGVGSTSTLFDVLFLSTVIGLFGFVTCLFRSGARA